MRGGAWPAGLQEQVSAALSALEKRAGKRLGDAEDPLLVSVRWAPACRCPGMMDTVLNLGLNDELAAGLAARTGEERFAWDATAGWCRCSAMSCAGSRASASRTRSRASSASAA